MYLADEAWSILQRGLVCTWQIGLGVPGRGGSEYLADWAWSTWQIGVGVLGRLGLEYLAECFGAPGGWSTCTEGTNPPPQELLAMFPTVGMQVFYLLFMFIFFSFRYEILVKSFSSK